MTRYMTCCHGIMFLFSCSVDEGGTLLPRIPYEEGFHRLVVRINQIGLKDAHVYINPFFTVSVKGKCVEELLVQYLFIYLLID